MTSNREHFVVALCASAGGLEAMHEFFDHMPDSANLSFVIVQHLSSDYKSLLVELVSRHTHMKVSEAESDVQTEQSCIYVIPNNKLISIQKNKLILEDKKKSAGPNNTIDTFLYTLADDKKNKAIAVILSGTGSDGTKGIEAIKKNQGMVIVQNPVTARFNGMPNSAIALGIADHVLPPAEMPGVIIDYIHEPDPLQPVNFEEEQLEEIISLIHQTVGFDFHYYKLPTIIRRITGRMMQVGINNTNDFIALLRNDHSEARQLANDFLIGVTRFFRDKEAWDFLQQRIITDIISGKKDYDTIKAWSCACSTGEEAYTLAIILNELVETSGKRIDIKIFASDIDEASIEIAAKGCYPSSIRKDVEAALLDKYFQIKGTQYEIVPRIRKQLVFTKHDVIRNPPFINNDIVSCRNLLIYVSPHFQKQVFSLLMFALNKNAFLFLGISEHSTYIRENTEEISAKWKIYKKVKDAKIASLYLPSFDRSSDSEGTGGKIATTGDSQPIPIWDAMKQALRRDLSVAGFFIDENFEIRETAGNYEQIIRMSEKNLRLNLLGMAPPELFLVLRSAIGKARKEGGPASLKKLKATKNGKPVFWDVLIKPMQPYSLVVVTEYQGEEISSHEAVLQTGNHLHDDEYVAGLHKELDEVRGNLALAVEELKTANEELQSGNEELLSTNEELRSSNEELQSLNEELHSLNAEHQLKIKQLVELNDDLNNYFRSTDIAQIFVDKNLIIRKFNKASYDLINFIDSDIGRPLEHMSTNIQYDDFLESVRRAMNFEITEKEVSLSNGRNLLMRIMPYLNRNEEVAGVIITFVDITTVTQLNSTIRAVLDSSPGFILGFTAVRKDNHIEDFQLQTANNAAEIFLNKPENELSGSSLKKDLPQVAQDGLFEQYVKVVEDHHQLHKDMYIKKEERWYNIIASKMLDGFVVTFSDITAQKKAEQRFKKNYLELVSVKNNLRNVNEHLENKIIERTLALGASEERFRLVSRATNDAVWEWNLVNNTMWLGDKFFKLFGYSSIGQQTNRSFWLSKIHPDDALTANKSLNEAINGGGNQWSIEYRFLRESGGYADILDRGYILHDEFGTPYRMLGSMFDATELKTAQHELATMNEQLELKVTERTKELEFMNSALELSNNDLQQFASVASHDLQEPLRKIQMFARLIQEESEGNADNPAVNYVNKILHSSTRMRSLITDILNYSRLSSNENNFEPTDLNELIKGTLDDFELTIKEKKAVISIDPLPVIDAISGQIRQVFQNLVSNALKFSKPSEPPVISISANTLAEKSFLSLPLEKGSYHLITVSDNGIGFDPQFTGKIFNLFHRLHSKDKFEGTGIGLAVTKRIVEKHNGLIRADSEENEGASFAIILPAKQQ